MFTGQFTASIHSCGILASSSASADSPALKHSHHSALIKLAQLTFEQAVSVRHRADALYPPVALAIEPHNRPCSSSVVAIVLLGHKQGVRRCKRSSKLRQGTDMPQHRLCHVTAGVYRHAHANGGMTRSAARCMCPQTALAGRAPSGRPAARCGIYSPSSPSSVCGLAFVD